MIKCILLKWLGCYLYHEATRQPSHLRYTYPTTSPKGN